MRALAALILLAAATPAAAQTPDLDALRFQQQQLQQRNVAQTNELMALEARLKAEQAVAEQQLARAPVRVPEPLYTSSTPRAKLDTSKLPSIPDAALADSNRRVQAIVGGRR
jgi:hypothetical protein